LSPFVLGFFFLQILLDTTNRQIRCRWQEENKQKSHKNNGQFPFCHHLIMEDNSTWIQENLQAFQKPFWPLPWQLIYKKGLLEP